MREDNQAGRRIVLNGISGRGRKREIIGIIALFAVVVLSACSSGLSEAEVRDVVGEYTMSGPTGPQGPQGMAGSQGVAGQRGLPGKAGTQGQPGLDGVQGELGMQGERGPQGDTGMHGQTGERGLQGERGSQGERGMPGLQGEPGMPGERGLQGEQGPQGERGERGYQGASALPPQPANTATLIPDEEGWFFFDNEGDSPFMVLQAYETAGSEWDAAIIITCLEFHDPPQIVPIVTWGTPFVLEEASVKIGWDGEVPVREGENWEEAGGNEEITPPSQVAIGAFLNRMAETTHLEIVAFDLSVVEAKFNTEGFLDAIHLMTEACQ